MKKGRPKLAVVEGRVPLGLRVTPAVYDVIVARSEKSGRSMSAEVEMLLEQGLLTEKLLSAVAYMTITGKNAKEVIEESSDAA